jgi:hypothetical protein
LEALTSDRSLATKNQYILNLDKTVPVFVVMKTIPIHNKTDKSQEQLVQIEQLIAEIRMQIITIEQLKKRIAFSIARNKFTHLR